MEDVIIDIALGAAGAVAGFAVSMAAGFAAQWFLSKYQDTIQDWVKKNLIGHPSVTRVVVMAQQLSHHTKRAVKVKIGDAVYVLARMIGVRTDGTTERMTNPGFGEIKVESTRELTPEEIARYTGGRCQINENESESSLLQKGLIPEKVAVGMKLVDKEGNAAGAYSLCDSRQLQDLRSAC